jgi:ABC-type multidrug transport system fused ATPase/permease subunit
VDLIRCMKDFLRALLFVDAGRIIRTGRQRALDTEDAPPLREDLDPQNSADTFDTLSLDRFGRFLVSLFFATGTPARRLVALVITKTVVALSTPLLLHAVLSRLDHAESSGTLSTSLLVFAVALGSAGIVGAVVQQHWYYNALNAFAKIVNGMNRRVVRHALRLRRSSRNTMQTGDMVNHLSSDTDALAEAAFMLPEFTNSVIVITAVLTTLFLYLGIAAFASIVTLLLMAPLTAFVARRYRRLDHQLMELRDERVTLMSQILHGIRVIKYHAWESSVRAEVQDVRRREIGTRVSIVRTDALSTAIFISTTTIVAFAGFSTYVALGGQLTAPMVFACLALFAMLEEPFGIISHLLSNLQHARVATQRLKAYFDAPIRTHNHRPLAKAHQATGLQARDVVVRYTNAPANAVDHVSLEIAPGSAVAIVGSVGSGKSTLLRTLVGIQVPQGGSVTATGIGDDVRPRNAYVPQEAFIMNASVEDNIRFGTDDDAEMSLDAVLMDCALLQDIAAMPAGLRTEIGERGVNLSGGQKQRVSLARAAWHRPGAVFLDDPLSAVDVHTEDVLVERLLFGRWCDITRVVVTHRLQHLSRFTEVIFMDGGRVAARGTYAELMQNHAGFKAFVTTPAEAEAEAPQVRVAAATVEHAIHTTENEEAGRLTDDEDRATGAVGKRVYMQYVRAMTGRHPLWAPVTFVGLVATAAALAGMPILQTSWLGRWTDDPSIMSPMGAIIVYGLLGMAVLSGWIGERLLWLYRAAAAGRTIHDSALEGVLGAPLRFFDSTPMGRVLNRFARDMEGVDDHLSWNFEQSFKSLAQTLASLVLIISVLPLIVVVLVPVLLVYYRLQRDYRRAAREAKRLESISRSPRYAHFKEVVTGLDVIHGYGREQYFMDVFYDVLGRYQRMYWCSILLNRWFSVRVPLISGLVALATSVGIAVLAGEGLITAGAAGVVLTFALSFWGSLNWTVRAFSEVESRMTSVERLQHYAELEPEPSTTQQPVLDAAAPWPTAGRIDIEGLTVRYADHLPLVLQDVTFSVPGGSTVGVIGRTGSGKSTLFQSMFRFLEPVGGRIRIDGVDIASVPIDRLRRSIAIIPQDPTLFIGTVRSNLDRFSECSDADVWNALRRVQLDGVVRALPGGLDAPVAENGINFSQGQRQLLCMARAILTRARILVLDEATASVDVQTDAVIQQTVRTEFRGVTVMIIAHRLNTVSDADAIVELANGRVVRHGAPTA